MLFASKHYRIKIRVFYKKGASNINPKIISKDSFRDVDPTSECFIIKDTFDKNLCVELVNFLKQFSEEYSGPHCPDI